MTLRALVLEAVAGGGQVTHQFAVERGYSYVRSRNLLASMARDGHLSVNNAVRPAVYSKGDGQSRRMQVPDLNALWHGSRARL
jgi:hypothetical protein